MSRRDKVAEAIKQEISVILQNEVKDPRLGFITITKTEVSGDLRYAKVFFSVLGKDEDYKKTKDALNSASGFIRSLIAQRIRLRLAPEIVFQEDKSSEYSFRIEEVLNEIKQLNEPSLSRDEAKGTKKRRRGRSGPKKSKRLHQKK